MFSELDEYLKEFEMQEYALDYWYDEGFSIAQDMLSRFSEDDWNQLRKQLEERSLGWKRRLAYCLHDSENSNEIIVLSDLIESDDEELFEIAVDSLRCHNAKKIVDLESIKKEVLDKIVDRSNSSDSCEVKKRVIVDFFSKISN